MDSGVRPEEPRRLIRGAAGLIVAVSVVLLLLLWLPAYRWFFLISVSIGLVVWAALHYWHRYRPLREEDVENKHPLGLE